MRYRRLGRTGITVSEIGFGAWGIGGTMWRGGDDALALAALEAAFGAGLTFVDTALAYGDGHSERLVAQAVRGRPDIVIATKVPPKNRLWPAAPGVPLRQAFPADYVQRCAEQSARNLERPVDLLQFHVWRDDWLREAEWRAVAATLERLIAGGTVRAVGISVNDHEPDNALEAVRQCDLAQCVQVIYNIYDRSPERRLFPACVARDVGVIARVPLDEGGLTGAIGPGVTFPPGDWRHGYFRDQRPVEVQRRVERLKPVLLREAATLVEGALRFCLSQETVSAVIPGMRTPDHAHENCALSDGRALSKELLEELREHEWPRNFYA